MSINNQIFWVWNPVQHKRTPKQICTKDRTCPEMRAFWNDHLIPNVLNKPIYSADPFYGKAREIVQTIMDRYRYFSSDQLKLWVTDRCRSSFGEMSEVMSWSKQLYENGDLIITPENLPSGHCRLEELFQNILRQRLEKCGLDLYTLLSMRIFVTDALPEKK